MRVIIKTIIILEFKVGSLQNEFAYYKITLEIK